MWEFAPLHMSDSLISQPLEEILYNIEDPRTPEIMSDLLYSNLVGSALCVDRTSPIYALMSTLEISALESWVMSIAPSQRDSRWSASTHS